MKTTIVTENLIMLTRRNFVLPNAYLVREHDGFTLIDTTTRGAADKLIAAASRAGANIRRVALTHGHGDHAGSLDALKERLGEEVEVLIPEVVDRWRRVHVNRQRSGHKPLLPPLPARSDGDLGQGKGPGIRQGTHQAGADPARRRSWPRRASSHAGNGGLAATGNRSRTRGGSRGVSDGQHPRRRRRRARRQTSKA